MFKIGQVIHHKMFDYTGIVYGVDHNFRGSDQWYQQVARSRPPKDAPWYRVLVNGAAHTTYVAERNLEIELRPGDVVHPLLGLLFDELDDGTYVKSMAWDGDTPLIPTTFGLT